MVIVSDRFNLEMIPSWVREKEEGPYAVNFIGAHISVRFCAEGQVKGDWVSSIDRQWAMENVNTFSTLASRISPKAIVNDNIANVSLGPDDVLYVAQRQSEGHFLWMEVTLDPV